MHSPPARDAARRHPVRGRARRGAAAAVGTAAALLLGLSACADQTEPSPEETPTPPLEGPTEETSEPEEDGAQEDGTESGPQGGAQEPTQDPEGESQRSDDSEVLDASDFSSEAQESTDFPDMVTELPDDADELLLTEVRAGQHEGYDRIVFEHAGGGAPGWYAEYVDEALEPGSGFPLELDGEAILYISAVGLTPGNADSDQGQLELSHLEDPKGTVFEDVVTTFVHHGAASYYVGLDQQRDFRVSVWEHEDGPRLIIDVLQ